MKKLTTLLLAFVLLLGTVLGCVSCAPETTSMESLYEEAKELGFEGSYEEWLKIMLGTSETTGATGEQGPAGETGATGDTGEEGLSAYELYRKHHPWYTGSEEEWVKAMADGSLAASYTDYNIIFTLATIPPVLASLDGVRSGYETYACIERGKTYNGIANLSNFHAVSFDTANNTSAGFSEAQFEAMVEVIRDLNRFGNETFHIYVQDGTGLAGFMLAANAGLRAEQYDITMCEDGSGAYNYFKDAYLTDKTVSAEADEPYDAFATEVKEVEGIVAEILSKKDNAYNDYAYDLNRAAPLAALNGVTYWFQNQTKLFDFLKATDDGTNHSKLLTVFGVEGYEDDTDLRVELRFESISEAVDDLSETQRTDYLRLMYGSYYEDTYAALTRKTAADGKTPVPEKKLVFIGSRANGYPKLVSDATYGIGGLAEGAKVAPTYAQLDAKYKTDLIFGSEADYQLFLDTVQNAENQTGCLVNELDEVYRVAFNYYVDYIYTLKLTEALYGEDYDIIIKGHPREVIGEYASWTSHYTAGSSNFDKMMNALMMAFHEGDSIGKFIGTMPYGTAAENLAYLGAEITIGGLSSSTYTGYDLGVDVAFVLNPIDGDVTADTNLVGRYTEGNLLTHDKNGNEQITTFYNKGYYYETMVSYYTAKNDTARAKAFADLRDAWLRAQNQLAPDAALDGYGVNAQGVLQKPNA